MRKRRFRSLDEEAVGPTVNLTPLIDVVFVVLITFMIIAPMLDVDQVDLAEGVGLQKQEVKPSLITITVRKDNTIWYRGKLLSPQQLEKQLATDRLIQPNATAQIMQDRAAAFGTYQTVKNALEKAGFERMDVVLKPGT